MAKLSDADVKKTAELAKLDLSSEEISTYKDQLSQVLDFVEELNEVDTDNIDPTSQTTGLVNVYREDEINMVQTLPVADVLSGTDKIFNNYFVVPMLLTEKDN